MKSALTLLHYLHTDVYKRRISFLNLCNTPLSSMKPEVFRILFVLQEENHWHVLWVCKMLLCILALVISLLLEQEWSDTSCQQFSFSGLQKAQKPN